MKEPGESEGDKCNVYNLQHTLACMNPSLVNDVTLDLFIMKPANKCQNIL